MKSRLISGAVVALSALLISPVYAQEKKAEKIKAEKASGDVGLLDVEKNYMILVTKEGKLITLDYTNKSKVTMLRESPSKMSDIGLGSSASITYTAKGDKNVLTSIEYMPAKGGE